MPSQVFSVMMLIRPTQVGKQVTLLALLGQWIAQLPVLDMVIFKGVLQGLSGVQEAT